MHLDDASQSARTVLWWGRSDPDYARNRIVRQALGELGWRISGFSPTISGLGHLEARLRGVERPDVVWVPCFRQRDLDAGAKAARRWGVPLVFDPLISMYDKQLNERKKFPPHSPPARALLGRERGIFAQADVVVADTPAHAAYFRDTLGVAADRLAVVPVGAEPGLFEPTLMTPLAGRRARVLFYGSFIALQGPEVIVEAAKRCPDMDWTLLGDGPLRSACVVAAGDAPHITFDGRIGYDQLGKRIAEADILLGVFSPSEKAGRVVPNKVYQALACGRPVVTRRSTAYPVGLTDHPAPQTGLIWVEPGNAESLAAAVKQLANDGAGLPALGQAARATYDTHMSPAAIKDAVEAVLAKVLK